MRKLGKFVYPSNLYELVEYLTKHRVLNVKFPTRETVYTFKESNGNNLVFISSEGIIIQFPVRGYFVGTIEYNEDGFVRIIKENSLPVLAWFLYTGPKPWQKEKPEWQKQIEDWDLVFAGLKNFCD